MRAHCHYSFDISNCVAVDVEVYPNHWLVGFYAVSADGRVWHRVVDGDVEKLKVTLGRLKSRGKTIVTYNGDHYDILVIRAILAGEDPYWVSRDIVTHEGRGLPESVWSAKQGWPRVRNDHIDLSARTRNLGHITSLKVLAARLALPKLQELPVDPEKEPTDAEWQRIVRYNRVDLEVTWAVLNHFAPELEAITALANDFHIDLRSTHQAGIARRVTTAAFAEKFGRDPPIVQVPLEIKYVPPAAVARPHNEAAAAWFDALTTQTFPLVSTGEGKPPKAVIPKTAGSITIGGVKYTIKEGGLHSIDTKAIHRPDDECEIIDCDVSSYYPFLMLNFGITPRCLGEFGQDLFRRIVDARLECKRRAKETTDPQDAARLKAQAEGLKIVANSTYGNLGNYYSNFYDPEAAKRVTLTGQLLMLNLIESLNECGVQVLGCNTDGIIFKARRADESWRAVLAAWESLTGLALEVDRLDVLAVVATNIYVSRTTSGVLKRRGGKLGNQIDAKHAPRFRVLSDALAAALVDGVPPEKTIRECKDVYKFTALAQDTGSKASVWIDDATQAEHASKRLVRYYKSKGSSLRIERRWVKDGKPRKTTPFKAKGVQPLMDLPNRLPADIDMGWYLAEARREILKYPFPHLDPKWLEPHDAPRRLHEMGLTPCPKWGGKNLPPGAKVDRASYFWDWPSYPAIATNTGPEFGVLVLDVDDVAKFKLFVDRGNFPLYADRWKDFDISLVSYRGDATAAGVRTGRSRGKLIFRFEVDADHPIAKLRQSYWLKSAGFEVFYGSGVPTIHGQHPDGTFYKLDGTLTEPPPWLIELLTSKPARQPRKSSKTAPEGVAESPAAVMPATDEKVTLSPLSEPEANADARPAPVPVDPPEATQATLDDLRLLLTELAPELGSGSVGWREKDLDDGRVILVGRCPFEHESGTGSDGDLSAGYNEDGILYIMCKHQTCTRIPEIDRRLREPRRPAIPLEIPPLEITPIAQGIIDDLASGLVTLHHGPTGSGKSHGSDVAAVARYRLDQGTVIAVPTIRLAKETLDRIEVLAPDAIAAKAVALICHQDTKVNEQDYEDDDDVLDSDYKISPWTKIIICTHAQLQRRGYSKFLRGIYESLGYKETESANGEVVKRPAFAILIDEAPAFTSACHKEIHFDHRAVTQKHPDKSGGRIVPIGECPFKNKSGSCKNCKLVYFGGESRYHRIYNIRELAWPIPTDFNRTGEELRRPLNALEVSESDYTLGPRSRVGINTFAAPLTSWHGVPVESRTRRTALVYPYQTGKNGEQIEEKHAEIIGHMLEFAFRPVITWESAVDGDGNEIDAAVLRARIEQNGGNGDGIGNILFPWYTCGVRRLRFADLLSLEQLRRFAAANGVGVAFLSATMTQADSDILHEVWPDLIERYHLYINRKIRQVATVFVENRRGVESLVENGHLLTEPLEQIGLGLVFVSRKRIARSLYEVVKLHQPSVRLAVENDAVTRQTLHGEAALRCYVTYSRGVLGLGANVKDVRFLVVDARAFRSISSFTPGEITPEAFERSKGEERVALILQNIGRAIRGEEGKTVVFIILNADEPLREAIAKSDAITDGSELPPVVTTGDDIKTIVDQARRWLEANGGDWPDPDATISPKLKGRHKGSRTRTREMVLDAAERALRNGVGWADFRQREHPQRTMSKDEIAALKKRFQAARKARGVSDDGMDG